MFEVVVRFEDARYAFRLAEACLSIAPDALTILVREDGEVVSVLRNDPDVSEVDR